MLGLHRIGIAVAALGGASAASAHDFFLLPDQFTTQQQASINLQATVGSSFPKPEAAVPADRAERLFAIGNGAPKLTIAGPTATALGLRLTGARPGALVAVAQAKGRDVEYGEDRIPLILEEYRVSPQAQAAVAALAKPRTLKVLSRRFAKTIICVVSCRNLEAARRPAGSTLEFVAVGNGMAHFRLLSDGRALRNYPVDLVSEDGKRTHMVSDANGDVHLPAEARGPSMLFAAVLTPPSSGDRFTLDLSTLTFSRP